MKKRDFIKNMALLGTGGTSLFKNVDKWVSDIEHLPAAEVAKDEDFWANIRSGYRLKPDYINLENGDAKFCAGYERPKSYESCVCECVLKGAGS